MNSPFFVQMLTIIRTQCELVCWVTILYQFLMGNIFLQVTNDKCPYSKKFLEEYCDQIINEKNNNQIKELLSYLTEKCGKPIKVKQIFTIYDIYLSKARQKY